MFQSFLSLLTGKCSTLIDILKLMFLYLPGPISPIKLKHIMDLSLKNFMLFCLLQTLSLSVIAESNWLTAKAATRSVTITGFSRARFSMVLSTEVAGKTQQVFADVGDVIIDKGVFACLDETFVKLDIRSAQNDVAQHQVDIDFYRKQVSRYKKMVAKNSAAVSLFDDFERKLNNSKRLLQSNKIRQQRLQESQRRYCIYAPVGWRVIKRYVEPKQWLDVGKPVVMVGDYSRLLVPLALSLSELNALRQQAKGLQVYLPEYDVYIPATIERVSPEFDENSRKIQVDLQLQDNLPEHRGGIRVECVLQLADEAHTFLIAQQALDKRFEETWLQPKSGEMIRVQLLGYSANGLARIRSTEIKAGQQFKALK